MGGIKGEVFGRLRKEEGIKGGLRLCGLGCNGYPLLRTNSSSGSDANIGS